MNDVTITYLGYPVTITGFRISCRERRGRYLVLANSAKKKFLSQFYDKYGDFFTFSDNYIRDISNFLRSYHNSMIDELIKNGVCDANEDDILRKYGDFLLKSIFEFQDSLKELYSAIDTGMETERALRELRKATRTRMTSAGFGITGALAGMAISGTYNTASGLFHSAANAIGNSQMRIRYTESLKSLYRSSEFRDIVGKCIWDSVFSIVFVIEDCMGLTVVDPEDYESKAQALRRNFSKIPEDAKTTIALEILELSPYNMETYKLLLPLYGDPDSNLYKLVQEVEPDKLWEFEEIRKKAFKEKMKNVCSDIDKFLYKYRHSMQDILEKDVEVLQVEAERKVAEGAKSLNYSMQDSVVVEQLQSVRKHIEKAKTVNGITYDTIALHGFSL